MANTFTGRIVFIGKAENVGKKKPFLKRQFVVDDSVDDRYPNPVPFELTRGECELVEGYHVGDEVRVTYFLNGRAWENPMGKTLYFVALRANAIERTDGSGSADAGEDADAQEGGSDDDTPF